MTARRLLRAARRRLADDRGAGSAEIVVATPLLMLLILLVIQFGIWAHATHVAQATAEEALAAAETQAQAATERMSLPLVLLFAGFLLLVGYPAIVHVLTGL